MSNNQQAGGCVLFFMGIIFAGAGFAIAYFGGAEQYFTCNRSKGICVMESQKMFSEMRKKEYEVEMSNLKKAVVKSIDSDDGVTYKVFLELKDDLKLPVGNVSSSDYSGNYEKAQKINNYLISFDDEFELIDKNTVIKIFGFVFAGVGVLMLLGSFGGLLKMALALAFFAASKR